MAWGALAQRASISRARTGLLEYYTLAPRFLGGSIARAKQQAEIIQSFDAIRGHRAYAFIDMHLGQTGLARKEFLGGSALQTYIGRGPRAWSMGADRTNARDAMRRYRPPATERGQSTVTPLSRSSGYGSIAVPFHHSFDGGSLAIAKCRCGVFGGALPVVPT